jgi:hypothetical protein
MKPKNEMFKRAEELFDEFSGPHASSIDTLSRTSFNEVMARLIIDKDENIKIEPIHPNKEYYAMFWKDSIRYGLIDLPEPTDIRNVIAMERENARELLIDFLMEVDEVYGMHVREDAEKCADNYLKSINSL